MNRRFLEWMLLYLEAGVVEVVVKVVLIGAHRR
jgi:hypothetical protein